MVFTQKDSIKISDFFNDLAFSIHLPMADDETKIIVRQDDCKPSIFIRGTLKTSGLFEKYMDCTVYYYQVNLDMNYLVICIKDGDKKWKD